MSEVRHPSGLFTIDVPADWETAFDVEDVALVVVDPVDDFGFQPNLVVTVEHPEEPLDVDRWFSAQPEVLAAVLEDARLLDLEVTELSGQPAMRLLVHHFVDGAPVTVEQWTALVGGLGWFVSGSVASLSYDHLADRFRDAAHSMRIAVPTAGGRS